MNRSKSCYEARETLDRRPGNSNPAGGGAFDSDPGLLEGLRALVADACHCHCLAVSAGRPLFILSGVLSDPPCSWHGGNFKCRSTITGNGVPIHWHFKPAARASDGTLYQLRLKFSSLANPSSIDDMDATRIPAGTPEHGHCRAACARAHRDSRQAEAGKPGPGPPQAL